MQKKLNALLDSVVNRNVLLFLGSGFSRTSINLAGSTLPLASELAKKIADSSTPPFDAENDLRYAAERFLKEVNDPLQLVNLLKDTFTITRVEESHETIARIPWRRVYTTNYDLCYEEAAKNCQKRIDCVDLDDGVAEYIGKNSICVHLNGSLNSLRKSTLESSFKLATSSYLSTDSFENSEWSYLFKKDLEFATSIVFIGYSLYDIEIQKILHNNPDFVEKTFFIQSEVPNPKSDFTLGQYGTVFHIGIAGFANELKARLIAIEQESPQLTLQSIREYRASNSSVDIHDDDVANFLMRGEISDAMLESALTGGITNLDGSPIVIARDELRRAKTILLGKGNLAIISEFGNGKSVFLRELQSILSLEGNRVFVVENNDITQYADLEQLVKWNIKGFLFVDSYDQNIELIKSFCIFDPQHLCLVLAERTGVHERQRDTLKSLKLKINELSIDELSDTEAKDFIEIVDNIGMWGDKAGYPEHKKLEEITKVNRGLLSINLLSLLTAPQMIDRLKQLTNSVLGNSMRKDTIFAIALLSYLDKPLQSSLISEVARNNEIYSMNFRDDVGFKQLFHFKNSKFESKSSVLSLALIANLFSGAYIIDQLLKIVAAIGDEFVEVPEKNDLRKNLLRFSVVERLLPPAQRIQNLVKYYESLKLQVRWLQHESHFWLQYGMAQLAYKEFNRAQSYFDQAYALAKGKIDYHTHYIDAQQARLHLMQATISDSTPNDAFKLFDKAHQLLHKLPEEWHKYTQVENYKDIYDKLYTKFSATQKASFQRFCKQMLHNLTFAIHEQRLLGYENKANRLAKNLQQILDSTVQVKTVK